MHGLVEEMPTLICRLALQGCGRIAVGNLHAAILVPTEHKHVADFSMYTTHVISALSRFASAPEVCLVNVDCELREIPGSHQSLSHA